MPLSDRTRVRWSPTAAPRPKPTPPSEPATPTSTEANSDEHIDIDRSTLSPLTKPGIAGHGWRQRGPYLVCTSCPIQHSLGIGINRQLQGFDEAGNPILKKV